LLVTIASRELRALLPQLAQRAGDAREGADHRVVVLEVVAPVGRDHRLDLARVGGQLRELPAQRAAEAGEPGLGLGFRPPVQAQRVRVAAPDQLDRVDQRAVEVEQEGVQRAPHAARMVADRLAIHNAAATAAARRERELAARHAAAASRQASG
jgi:hypothetical protein